MHIENNGGFDANWQERFPMPESLEKPEFRTWLRGLDEVNQNAVIDQVGRSSWKSLRSRGPVPLEEVQAIEQFVSETLGFDLGGVQGEN